MKKDKQHPVYDYIITGAGCAGLSLLVRMMQHSFFNNKQILLIDTASEAEEVLPKNWCFWGKGEGVFEKIIRYRWSQIEILNKDFFQQFSIAPYTYKMVYSRDVFSYVKQMAAGCPQVHWLKASVSAVGNCQKQAFVVIDGEKIYANMLFNSVLFENNRKLQPRKHYLLQHFKGRMIETETPAFEETIARLMDFRTGQQAGTCFFYVLPVSPYKALVEYTVFSGSLLHIAEYDYQMDNYIRDRLPSGNYKVLDNETGCIPMTNHQFSRQDGRVIHIGTAGGDTKASTGYTFQFIQKTTDKIIAMLVNGGADFPPDTWMKTFWAL